MSRRRKIIALGVLTIGVTVGVLIIGALGYILFSSRAGNTEVVFAATEVGKPEGPNVTKNIGPAGGSIASPDGRLTLTVPQNALTETLPFSIQPITNKADGGLGLAYRLGPDGKTFTTPLEVSVRYDDHDLAGTAPEALTLAYQDGKGAWHAQKSPKLDQAAKTLTISTTHFTDEAFLARLRMSPAERTLYVGEDTCIQLIQCEERGLWDKIWSRPVHCAATQGEGNWKLRGPGRMDYQCARGVRYEAPLKKPTPNIAWVDLSAKIHRRDPITGETSTVRKDFSTKITILDRGYSASGKILDTALYGDICDLEKPFTIKTSSSYNSSFACVPSSPTTGTCTVSETKWGGGGGGQYTVTGTDTLKTGIELDFGGKAYVGGLTGTGSAPKTHINLVPLNTECKP